MQKHPSTPVKDTEALTKVQKWLLSSPQPTAIPKSKSIPLGLTERTHRQISKGTRKTRPSKSATNLISGEKARLQVVFKPPFRFSVKICKSDKTKVVLDKTSKPDLERKRQESAAPQTTSNDVVKTNPVSSKAPKHSNSTRIAAENILTPSEPKLEKSQSQKQHSTDHGYANLLPRSASDCKVGMKIPDIKIRNGHKKSYSVGQKKETTESRQNLIAHEDVDTNIHVYENVLMSQQETFVPKSCSMPRRQATVGISRQSSYGHLPRAQIRPHRHSTNNLSRSRNNSTTDMEHFYNTIETLRRNNQEPTTSNTNTSSSSGSSRHESKSTVSRGRTLRQNSLVDKPTRSSPIESSNVKLKRQMSEVELGRSPMMGFQLVVGKEKLKRQMSDNELCGSRVQLAMPMSAGTEPRQPFCWKRASLDCEASLPAPPNTAAPIPRPKKRTTYTFGELKNTVPDAPAPTSENAHNISSDNFVNIKDN